MPALATFATFATFAMLATFAMRPAFPPVPPFTTLTPFTMRAALTLGIEGQAVASDLPDVGHAPIFRDVGGNNQFFFTFYLKARIDRTWIEFVL
jgi:hypothetical protein